MSVHISVSNVKQEKHCKKILSKFLKHQIDCRTIETTSIVNNKIENGCLVTITHPDNSPDKVKQVWDILKTDYNCAHLKIDGIYSGCIYNYMEADFCPGNKL
jgi:hypothetical protein